MSDTTSNMELVSETFQEAFREYEKSNDILEEVRKRSRQARRALIEAIMCDDKDVLATSDVEAIHTELQKFLTVQTELHKAFYDNAMTSASLMAEA